MSHFVRCDRCETENHVLGTVSLPPGWEKVLNADLCESCRELVKDFIRFKPSDVAGLCMEPIPESAAPIEQAQPVGDKLFETAPEVSTDSQQVSDHAGNGKVVPKDGTDGDPEGQTQPSSVEFNPASEASIEERHRTRKPRKKVSPITAPGGEPPQPGAPA